MTTIVKQQHFKDMIDRSLDVNENQIKVGDWIRDAGKNESDRQDVRKQTCGVVLYVDCDIIVVKPLTKRMIEIYGDRSVVFNCGDVLIVNDEEKKEIKERYIENKESPFINFVEWKLQEKM